MCYISAVRDALVDIWKAVAGSNDAKTSRRREFSHRPRSSNLDIRVLRNTSHESVSQCILFCIFANICNIATLENSFPICRWCEVGSWRLHLLQCVSREGLIIWRLEYHSCLFRCHSDCKCEHHHSMNIAIKKNNPYL